MRMSKHEISEHNMKITSIDHLVLYVDDIDTSVAFYENVLAMKKRVFGDARVCLEFGFQKINLHPAQQAFAPHAKYPIKGSADLCFLSDTPLEQAMRHVRECGVNIIEGPVPRTGARGKIMSFYFYDPDGNLIEVANQLGD